MKPWSSRRKAVAGGLRDVLVGVLVFLFGVVMPDFAGRLWVTKCFLWGAGAWCVLDGLWVIYRAYRPRPDADSRD